MDGNARGRQRMARQTTPALLEHADTIAKARLHLPGIDTSIVPLDRTRKTTEQMQSERSGTKARQEHREREGRLAQK